MAYERKSARRRPRSAVRRAWLYSFWLFLPALLFAAILLYRENISAAPGDSSRLLPCCSISADRSGTGGEPCPAAANSFQRCGLASGKATTPFARGAQARATPMGELAGGSECARRPAAAPASALAGSNRLVGSHPRSDACAAVRIRQRECAAASEHGGHRIAGAAIRAVLWAFRCRTGTGGSSQVSRSVHSLVWRQADALAVAQGVVPAGRSSAHACCCWRM